MLNLQHGDCFELIKDIKDNSIDLVVIDPPYEFSTKYISNNSDNKSPLNKRKNKQAAELKLISSGFDLNILDELNRVMKKINIYIWCSKMQVSKILNYYESKKCNVDILTWHKTNPAPACNNTYLSDTEYLIFAREKGVKMYGCYETKRKYYVTPTNVKDKKLYKHPTIKPLHIIENLIINSSLENDTVLDCFMGSGTTGAACKKLNRKFIGIELDKDYFEIARNRIEAS
jgi:DNA modification methylase